MRKGKGKEGGYKIFRDEGKGGRKEGRGARSLTPPLNVFCSPRKNDCPN